jgi:ATP-dependent 26S proteasome regulatory subunit
MEDADAFLAARKDGNTLMHRFLNMSDGLISAKNKKLVFSTNLPNISDIDEALLRPGRCFDILQFRPLTRAEAQAALDEVGSNAELPDGNQFTLAELFCQQPSAADGDHRKNQTRMGFA